MLYWGGKSLLNPEPSPLHINIPRSQPPLLSQVITSRASVPSPSSLFPAEIGHLHAGSVPLPRGEEHWLVI